jgi:hypothetical protein
MQKIKVMTAGILLIAILLVMLSFTIPSPGPLQAWEFHTVLGLAAAIAVCISGSGILFGLSFGSIDNNPNSVRIIVSGVVTCLGLALFGVSFLSIPWGMLQPQYETASLQPINLAFCLGMAIIYLGNRSLTPMFKIKTWAQSLGYVLMSTVLLVGLLSLASYGSIPRTVHISSSIVYTALGVVLMLFTCVTVWQIKQVIGVAYVNRFAWVLLASIINVATIGLLNTLIVAIMGQEPLWAIVWIVVLPAAISSLFFLRASYVANDLADFADTQERAVARNFFGKPLQHDKKRTASSIDIVMVAASLVSNPVKIDLILDKVRVVTSQMEPGRRLPSQKEQIVMKAYLGIEDYLVQKEPLRSFRREELRRIIAQKLHLTTASNTFWNKLS